MQTIDKSRADALTAALSRIEKAVDWYIGRSSFTQSTQLKGLSHSDAVRKELYAAHDEARAVLSSPVEQHEAAPMNLKAQLRRAMDLLDTHLGDSDPMLEGLTQDEIEDEYPVVAAMQIVVSLHQEMEQPEQPLADERAANPIGYIRADDLKELADGNGAIVSPKCRETDVPVFARASSPNAAGAIVGAWLTDDDRAITAAQKQRAFADGGATASSVQPYSIPCYLGAAPARVVEGAKPVAWVRFRSDGGFEGPIMDSDDRMCDVRRKSGAWTPLFLGPAQSAEPVAWRHSHTLCLYETEEEVPLADGDEWAEPLYAVPRPVAIPAGYALVPLEPTEDMVVKGFESWPDQFFSKPEEWSAFEEMTGCQQAAHKARLCYTAMLSAAPPPPSPASAISTDECAHDVYQHGQSIGLFDIPKETANAICSGISTVMGASVDWHYIGGRVHMKALVIPASAPVELTDAARDVLAERRRQVEQEGWTPEHDDEHGDHAMSCAAGCYAMYTLAYPAGDPPPAWPWAADWWKPTTHRRNLIKAGALILAEIERLDRVVASAGDAS